MSPKEILEDLTQRFTGLEIHSVWGETSLFHNPDGLLTRGVYFLTIKEKGGDNDKASDLDRQWAFRLNFGIDKQTFITKFGSIPTRPPKGGIISMDFDFTKQNVLMPHQVYGWMCWAGILNPSKDMYQSLLLLINTWYQNTVSRFINKKEIKI